MVTVPGYQRTVAERPIFQQDLADKSSPEAFGAGLGQGMQQLGQGVNQLGDAMAQVRQMEDVARAKEADNSYASWLRERQYGQDGFMTLSGKTAVDGRQSFEKEAADKRMEFGKGLPPGASQAYESASNARLQSTLESSIVHTANERKTWFKDASGARVASFADDALVNFSKPAAVQKNLAAGIMELRQQGAAEGWGADALKLHEQDFVSGVHKNITLRLAQDDPLKANEYLKANAGQISGKDQYDLTNSLESAVKEEQSKREADTILSGGRTVSSLPGDIVGEVAGVPSAGKKTVSSAIDAKTFLSTVSAHQGRPGDTSSLDDSFAVNLAAMISDAPPAIRKGLGLFSGYRSPEKQQSLFNNSDKTGHSVAFPPGYKKPDGSIAKGSNHNRGMAADLSYDGQSLANAPKEVVDYVHENAAKYGLRFPMSYEPWHIEPTGARSGTVEPSSNTVSSRSSMPSYDAIEAGLDKIADPKVRDLTRQRIYTAIGMQSKAAEANQNAAKATLWQYVDAGKSPDDVPIEVKQAAGMAAVSSAWSYMESASRGRDVKNDETLTYDMRKYAAGNPAEFAKIDLNEFRDRLSKETIKEFTGLQTGALTDQRKAAETGLNLTNAYSQATTQLEAVGISTTGKKGSARDAEAARIAQFQNSLTDQMTQFAKDNEGKAPTQADVQSMISKLLLPIIVKTPGTLWDSNEKKLLFEARNRADGTSVTVDVQYSDIPIDLRSGISVDLERELGRKPSQQEIVSRYQDFVMSH